MRVYVIYDLHTWHIFDINIIEICEICDGYQHIPLRDPAKRQITEGKPATLNLPPGQSQDVLPISCS
jgi:hypothetical protein